MKRFLISFFLGAVPAALLLVLLRPGPRTAVVPEPAVEAPRPPDPEVFEKWQAARSDSATEALRYLESLDADAARALLARIEAMDEGEEKKSARVEAFERFAEIDRVAALAYAEATWPFPERIAFIGGTVLKWSDTDIDACWDWIDRTEARATAEEEGSGAWWGLLSSIYKERAFGTPSAKEIARTWRELERCLEAVSENGTNAIIPRDGVIEHPLTKKPAGSIWSLVVDARQREDWAATFLRLRKLPRINRPIPTQVLHDWLEHDLEGALAWVAGQADPELREEALTAMAARQSLGQGTEARVNRAELLRQLMVIAPEIAIKELSGENPREASAWLAESLDTLPNPDSARVSLANALATHDIDAAFAWAGSIEAEHQRKATTHGILWQWGRAEPWAAEAWAGENLGWTDEEFARELRLER